ncbi:arginine--tRNA ligase [Falseniella ignava]|uniref:Arginine--tRNA ligase n=1 Tax=Falseniella ignava CCUG 37419 TaxID=883112 RepID=K1M111_9LACT|nr:arginine--tRNA ligase [Falseniella ignava]EKB57972.1 arginine-tRNA ligase [Falseniella ignava CCUG 37419]
MNQREIIAKELHAILYEHLSYEQVEALIEVPNNTEHGDLAFPVFTLAKAFRKAPNLIAEELVEQIDTTAFSQVASVGPYINFKLDRQKISDQIIKEVNQAGENYGSLDIGQGKNVTIDMSSPNIAKPMSMGHLRSTVIGNALSLILKKINYHTININHLGDWGTQFGKLIVAYQKWGDEAKVKADPVNELVKLYVEFHERAEEDPSLDDEGRAAFKRLEEHDPEMIQLWTWFKDESLKEFDKVYKMLNVHFDHYTGESFYNDKMDEIVDLLEEKGLSEIDQGSLIVRLDEYDLPPALIKKSDGATLYITRDLATAYYRHRTYHFDQSLYVVGNEQSNHFKQLKAVLEKMGNDWAQSMHHIPFGLITVGGKKLSTRKGKIILLEEVLNEAIRLASEQIEAKNPDLPNKEEVAHQVGVGAVVFHDLKNDRTNNFDFELEEVVQFEGETGPYVQYTHARIHSILSRYEQNIDLTAALSLTDDYSWELVKKLQAYPSTIVRAAERYEPSIISKYVIQLAQLFNRYYANVRILNDDEELNARMALLNAVATVIKDGLSLLGVAAPERM